MTTAAILIDYANFFFNAFEVSSLNLIKIFVFFVSAPLVILKDKQSDEEE